MGFASPRRRFARLALAAFLCAGWLMQSGCQYSLQNVVRHHQALAATQMYNCPQCGKYVPKHRPHDCRCPSEPGFYGHRSTCWNAWPTDWQRCPPPNQESCPAIGEGMHRTPLVPQEEVIMPEPAPSLAPPMRLTPPEPTTPEPTPPTTTLPPAKVVEPAPGPTAKPSVIREKPLPMKEEALPPQPAPPPTAPPAVEAPKPAVVPGPKPMPTLPTVPSVPPVPPITPQPESTIEEAAPPPPLDTAHLIPRQVVKPQPRVTMSPAPVAPEFARSSPTFGDATTFGTQPKFSQPKATSATMPTSTHSPSMSRLEMPKFTEDKTSANSSQRPVEIIAQRPSSEKAPGADIHAPLPTDDGRKSPPANVVPTEPALDDQPSFSDVPTPAAEATRPAESVREAPRKQQSVLTAAKPKPVSDDHVPTLMPATPALLPTGPAMKRVTVKAVSVTQPETPVASGLLAPAEIIAAPEPSK